MRRLPPSVQVRQELHRLLERGADAEASVVSAFVELAIRLVAQQLLEAEQADVLGAGAATSADAKASRDRATATSPAGSAPPRARSPSRSPRCVGAPSRSAQAS